MDVTVAEYIRRTVLKIPRDEIKTMLQKWGFLSETQLQTVNFHQIKENISQDVVQLCEVILFFGNCLSVTYRTHVEAPSKNHSYEEMNFLWPEHSIK